MGKFLFVYHGGGMPETEEAQRKTMEAWMQWLSSLGDKVIDGGNPVGVSSTVMSDGSVTEAGGANPATGYGLFEASDKAAAVAMAKGCPILSSGGSVEVAEIFEP